MGGRPCLDFANTVGPRRPAPGVAPHDYLPGYPELVTWAAGARILPEEQAPRLGAAAGDSVYREAMCLREAIYLAFDAVADGRTAPPAALAAIEDAYRAALRHAHLRPGSGWAWPDDGPPEQLLWALAHDAVDLLTSGPLDRIKVCPGDDGTCGWLFVDTSKNAARRWCSMRTCGSRVKSRRQVARVRATRIAHGSRGHLSSGPA